MDHADLPSTSLLVEDDLDSNCRLSNRWDMKKSISDSSETEDFNASIFKL